MSIAVGVLIIGIITYVIQFRHRRLLDLAEKDAIIQQHQLELLSTQLQIQKETAEHIGREIHDSVTQKLTLASIYLHKIQFDKKRQMDDPEIVGINNILSNALAELRALSKDLTEDLLNNTSLESLIEEELKNVNRSGMCTAQLKIDFIPELKLKAKTSILRIIQEFIQNSLKHSGCKNIYISMKIIADNLEISLKDDGKGFLLDDNQFTGIGLESIRRRVEIIGAVSSLHSEPGDGTVLEITVKLNDIIA